MADEIRFELEPKVKELIERFVADKVKQEAPIDITWRGELWAEEIQRYFWIFRTKTFVPQETELVGWLVPNIDLKIYLMEDGAYCVVQEYARWLRGTRVDTVEETDRYTIDKLNIEELIAVKEVLDDYLENSSSPSQD